jgi:hypothetical protein
MTTRENKPGVMVHTYNPSYSGGIGRKIEFQSKPRQLLRQIRQTWWHMPVIPATWEAQVGELKLQDRAKIETHLKKKKTTRKHLKQKGLEEWLKGQAQGPEFKHKYHHRRRKGKRQTNKNH